MAGMPTAPAGCGRRRRSPPRLGARAARRATLITSQLPIEHWRDMIDDTTFGDAILDRLVHHTQRVTLAGGATLLPAPTD
jgi:hypothetical protein